jgi:hypothetical protein
MTKEEKVNPDILSDTVLFKPWNMHKLITHEDAAFMHVHKFLGIASLAHYIYRLHLWLTTGSMNFEANGFTLAMIILHAALSISSLQFKISSTRIASAPMIYPEFRAHSILFAYRSLICMLMHWSARAYGHDFLLYFRGPLVLLTLYAADRITSQYKEQGSTMRGMPFPSHVPTSFRDAVNLFYSVCQVFATAEVLFAFKMDQLFAVLFPIQIAAFLMTCVRKSIISAGAWHFYYAMSLLANFVFGLFPGNYLGGFLFPSAMLVCVLRIGLHANKYVVWTAVTAAHLYAMLALGRYNTVTI